MKQTELVYSTNPTINRQLCIKNGRRFNLYQPITSSVMVGKPYESMVVCEVVNQASKESKVVGQYKGTRHVNRRSKRYNLATMRAMNSIVHSK